jgi:hypothetical protein
MRFGRNKAEWDRRRGLDLLTDRRSLFPETGKLPGLPRPERARRPPGRYGVAKAGLDTGLTTPQPVCGCARERIRITRLRMLRYDRQIGRKDRG